MSTPSQRTPPRTGPVTIVGRTIVDQGRPTGPLGRRVRLTESGWVMTFLRPWRTLLFVALAGLPGLVGCLVALGQWSGNRFMDVGVAAYVALLALAFAWLGTIVHTLRLEGPQLHAARLVGTRSLTLTSLTRVVVDDASTLRRSASGEWYRRRASYTVVHAGSDVALVCEEPRLARDLARRLLALRPRLAGRPDEPAPDPSAGRLYDVGPTSRIRRWGTGVVGPLGTIAVALLLCVSCLGVLGVTQGAPGPARPAAPVLAALAWPAPTHGAPGPATELGAGVAAAAPLGEVAWRSCDNASHWPWSGDARNGVLTLDAGAAPLTAAQLTGVRQRAQRLGLTAERSGDPATTVFVRQRGGARWVLAWHVEGDVRAARFGIWTDCLDSRELPDDLADHLRRLAGYALTGTP